MSNVGKAANFIAGAWPGGQGIDRARSRELAERMEEAGLLAPRLSWDSVGSYAVNASRNSKIVWIEDTTDGVGFDLTPGEARRLAHALLAAVAYMEGEHG